LRKLITLKPRVQALAAPQRATPVHIDRLRGSGLQARNRRLQAQAPLCVECEKQGRVRAVTQWDHIVPLWSGGPDHERNLQGLCDECHEIKTKREESIRRSGESIEAGGIVKLSDRVA
jgi:5-methylcytosine-specific restriction endonuclease McrA